MKINFQQILYDIDNKPMAWETNDDGSMKTPATLGIVAIQGLMSPHVVNGTPSPLQGVEALRAIDLSMNIKNSVEPLEVTADDIVYIKERIAANFNAPIVVGMAWRALESND